MSVFIEVEKLPGRQHD